MLVADARDLPRAGLTHSRFFQFGSPHAGHFAVPNFVPRQGTKWCISVCIEGSARPPKNGHNSDTGWYHLTWVGTRVPQLGILCSIHLS
jgi:hypothetical protein